MSFILGAIAGGAVVYMYPKVAAAGAALVRKLRRR